MLAPGAVPFRVPQASGYHLHGTGFNALGCGLTWNPMRVSVSSLVLLVDNRGRSYLNKSMEKEHTLSDRERELLEEIQEFNKERERIRKVIGEIGGTRYSRRDTIINIAFLTVILLLFISEVLTMWLPTFISIEVGILLVSIKIVWMIHAQQKYNHFVFWVLNSIEFRQNDMTMKLRSIEKSLETIAAQTREPVASPHSPLGNSPP